jgi:hypothetical protein
VVALVETVGFSAEEVKPLGPVHDHVTGENAEEAVKPKVAPTQIGPLFPTVGGGGAVTVAVTVTQ